MSTGLIAFLLFVVAFIVRAVTSGLELEDWVLWALAGLAMMTVGAAVAVVQRRPARTE